LIFVTVGEQMPFDRLVRAVDAWAGRAGRGDVFAQVGSGAYRPQFIEAVPSLEPSAYRAKLEAASVVIAHAGMGTIISAAQRGVPLIVMPRRSHLQETRNDHQRATAEHFGQRGLAHVAQDERELAALLDRLDQLPALGTIGETASSELLQAIRDFL
jgi:UDP-N-acetylglucosamine transferase subunit ALG13